MTCGILGRCQAMPSRQNLDLNLSGNFDYLLSLHLTDVNTVRQ
jgi:hypothetical protein